MSTIFIMGKCRHLNWHKCFWDVLSDKLPGIQIRIPFTTIIMLMIHEWCDLVLKLNALSSQIILLLTAIKPASSTLPHKTYFFAVHISPHQWHHCYECNRGESFLPSQLLPLSTDVLRLWICCLVVFALFLGHPITHRITCWSFSSISLPLVSSPVVLHKCSHYSWWHFFAPLLVLMFHD